MPKQRKSKSGGKAGKPAEVESAVIAAEAQARQQVQDTDASIAAIIAGNQLQLDEAAQLVSDTSESLGAGVAEFEHSVADAVVKLSQRTGKQADAEGRLDDQIIAAEERVVATVEAIGSLIDSDTLPVYEESCPALAEAEDVVAAAVHGVLD